MDFLQQVAVPIGLEQALQARPWAKALYPPTWKRFRRGIAGAQTEADARAVYDDLVCESGRVVLFELALPWLDRTKAARVEPTAVTGPVLIIAGERDHIIPPRVARRTAARYRNSSYVEIPGSDHLVFASRTLPITMARIDDWIIRNQLRSAAPN
jgi:pimeloyl-ACP methyl ester carboxylesterase